MICCLESPFNDAKSSYYSQVSTDEKLLPGDEHNKKGGSSSYPGMRRTPHGPPAASSNMDGLISVTVPPGVLPGQEIHVQRPDGNGLVEAVVPPGMKEGSVFYVKAPPSVGSNPRQTQKVAPYEPLVTHASASSEGDFLNENTNLPPNNTSIGNHPAPPTTTNSNMNAPKAPPGQELVRVQVPLGMEPGTTILVSIPNEPGRHVQAQIPPNVSEFLVAYEPNKKPKKQENSGDAVLPIIGGIATGVAAVMAYEHFS